VGGGLAFTTSPAMACWASGPPTVSSSRRICRGRAAPPRCGVGAHVCLKAPMGRAVAAHDKEA
jgi:hypothetical protein